MSQRRVTHDFAFDAMPAWSPDGTSLDLTGGIVSELGEDTTVADVGATSTGSGPHLVGANEEVHAVLSTLEMRRRPHLDS